MEKQEYRYFIFCVARMAISCATLLLLVAIQARAQAGRSMAERVDTSPSVAVKKNDTLTVAQVWKRSLIAPGFGQFFNRHYWKMPIVIGGIGGFAYGAYASAENRAWYIAGALTVYWASLLDATACYRYDKGKRLPSKAAIYATLLPGLGQAYNQKYWKLPLVYGGFLAMGYLIQSRNFRLNLFTKAYAINYELGELKSEMGTIEDSESPEYKEMQTKYTNLERQLDPNFRTLSLDRLKSYKDIYRRDRDYYIILTCLFYAITIIDAVVDAHFSSYDISNNLSFQWSPFVERWAASNNLTTGISFNIRF